MKNILKRRVFQLTILCLLIIITVINYSESVVELPRRPIREYATMTMALNQDKTESVRLKIPWGYLAPNISYMSLKDQKSFFAKAKGMMLLMGLSSKDSSAANTKPAAKPIRKYTTAYSIDALYPTFEAKNEHNIDQFEGKRDVISKVVKATVFSISKGRSWNNWKKSIKVSYDVYLSSLERQLHRSKTFKHYGFAVKELPSKYGLIKRGISYEAVQRLRADGFIEGFIPRVFLENRNEKGELLSFMRCMQLDLGWRCLHTMHVASINSRVVLSYHSSLLKDWQNIENKTRQLFEKFIVLGKEYDKP